MEKESDSVLEGEVRVRDQGNLTRGQRREESCRGDIGLSVCLSVFPGGRGHTGKSVRVQEGKSGNHL